MRNNSFLFAGLICLALGSITSCTKDSDPPSDPIVIGQHYGGGIVFYVDGSGQHGLVAATSDLAGGYWDHCGGSDCGRLVNGANAAGVGTGAQNTIDIVNSYGTDNLMAASQCDQLVFEGYSDWFLPSKDELHLLYQYKDIVGGGNLDWDSYWSSTQFDEKEAYYLDFSDGTGGPDNKAHDGSVRAIRAF